jgi:putative Ca2+/H+ antiporter (TMEM165/GDT1 family)
VLRPQPCVTQLQSSAATGDRSAAHSAACRRAVRASPLSRVIPTNAAAAAAATAAAAAFGPAALSFRGVPRQVDSLCLFLVCAAPLLVTSKRRAADTLCFVGAEATAAFAAVSCNALGPQPRVVVWQAGSANGRAEAWRRLQP